MFRTGCANCAPLAARGHEHPDSGRIDAIDEAVDGTDRRIDGFDRRIDGTDRGIGGFDRGIDGIDGRIDATGHRPLTCSTDS